MAHHHEEKEKSVTPLYYLVGIGSGLFTGLVIEKGIEWIIALGIVGLLFTAFFLQVFVRGREER